jgi:hypothetical protein
MKATKRTATSLTFPFALFAFLNMALAADNRLPWAPSAPAQHSAVFCWDGRLRPNFSPGGEDTHLCLTTPKLQAPPSERGFSFAGRLLRCICRFLARMRPTGRADQCPQLGVERTQRHYLRANSRSMLKRPPAVTKAKTRPPIMARFL